MPYPPPPPPPTVGEFQAIGRLEAPSLPDVTGNAGKFLETDGVIPQWEPVSGVLPDPTGHGGQFLTTDGVNPSWAVVNALPDQTGNTGKFLTTDGSVASWATISAGGVTTIGALTTPTANAAVISGGNTLQLAPADFTHPGLMDITPQTFAAYKKFPNGASVNIHDLINVGAPLTFINPSVSCSDYIDAAITAAIALGEGTAAVYLPEGTWMIDRPILISGAAYSPVKFYGDGRRLTTITMGTGSYEFAGPMMLCGNYGPQSLGSPSWLTPTYGSALLGTGRSLNLEMPFSFWLHDAWAWITYMYEGPNPGAGNPFCVQCEVRIDDLGINKPWPGWQFPDPTRGPPQQECVIIGSRGMNDPVTGVSIAWGFYAERVTDTTFKVRAYLSTKNEGKQFIDSGTFNNGDVFNLELNYDGTSQFWFYVNGTQVGVLSATGWLLRYPDEGISIGSGCPEWLAGAQTLSIFGAIDSIRLSNVVRHAQSVASFTPPTSKYTWDSNTYALCNWDQADPPGPVNQPFVMGQARSPWTGSPIRHFVRFNNTDYAGILMPQAAGLEMHDFGLSCGSTASGIIAYQTSRSMFKDLIIVNPTFAGFSSWDPGSFFTDSQDIVVFGGYGYGILQYAQSAKRNSVTNCRIGQHYLTGSIEACNTQPGGSSPGAPYYDDFSNYFAFVFGGSIETFFSYVNVRGSGIDAEGTFTQTKAGVRVLGVGTFLSDSNVWAIQGGSWNGISAPAIQFDAIPDNGATLINDVFNCNGDARGQIVKNGSINGKVKLISPRLGGAPLSDEDGWIITETSSARNNQTGLSISDVQANNLAGTFQATHGYSVANVLFFTPEPDANYVVVCSAVGYTGSPPAAGSTSISKVDASDSGFLVTLGADPGGSCVITFAYVLVRVQPAPLYFAPTVSIPSSIANPLVGIPPTSNWAVGVTVVPTDGKCIKWTDGIQTILETSTRPTNWWTLTLNNGISYGYEFNAAFGVSNYYEPFTYQGRLYGLAQPGPHNIILGFQDGRIVPSVDGGFPVPYPYPANLTLVQQTPITIGETAGHTQALTAATLRNLKIDTFAARVATPEPDYGPLNRPQSAVFGSAMTLGMEFTTAGSWACQVAANRYATKYYWNASRSSWQITTDDQVATFWTGWGSAQTFEAIAVQLGTENILNQHRSATDTWNGLLGLLEGTFAQAVFIPPTGNSYATAKFTPPTTGTATCVIDGYSFLATFRVDAATTVLDLINLINLNGTVTALVTPTLDSNALLLTAVAPGPAGNGITTTSNNANGAGWYYNLPATSGGAFATCVVAGTSFNAIFNTDANTTLGDLLALISADAPTMALVTPVVDSVNHIMVFTAVARGSGGNAITLTTNLVNGARVGLNAYNYPPTTHLSGAVDGALAKAIPIILVCNLPPMGDDIANYNASVETQRLAFNTLASNWCTANAGAGAVLVDTDVALRLSSDHTKIDPTYLATSNFLNDAGQTVLYGLLNPLLP